VKSVCVIAPHPDDELLGAGGTILSTLDNGGEAFWLIVTGIFESGGFSADAIAARDQEINTVAAEVPFTDTCRLNYPTTMLDTVPGGQLVSDIKLALEKWQPDTVIIPWRHDAHTDHTTVFDAAMAATKAFRAPFIRTVLAMEILSETNFARQPGFIPNWYVDISEQIDRKITLLNVFKSEFAPHPFPRSEDAVRALATLRGSEAGSRDLKI